MEERFAAAPSSVAVASAAATSRLLSLDVFRGLTMAGMVIVNNPGDWGTVYSPLLHAEWNGWTPTDLIFPFFLFIVGVSLTLSRSTMGSWGRIVRRAGLIFLVGLILAGIPRFPFATWRIPGVLQRIAVCYLAAATIFRITKRQTGSVPAQAAALAGWAAFFMLAYWAVMSLVAPPGGMAGDLSPAGNLGAYVDRTLMGRHLWQQRPWDPEGLMSTVPAIATALLGCMAGLTLASNTSAARKSLILAGAGAVLVIVGLAWHEVFPINKNLWTSSYVAFSGGAAALLLAGCYWTIDVRGWRAWTKPFQILGMNAIALFVLSALLAKLLIYVRLTTEGGRTSLGQYLYVNLYVPIASPKNASLLFALTHLAVMFLILTVMYRKKIFVKL
ncbi:MAG: acyltransferase family protein [Bacteroidales bacterium]